MAKILDRARGAAKRVAAKMKARAVEPAGSSSTAPTEPLEKPAERLKKLREAVDKGGNLANANFLGYLAILIYFFVAVTSTTHEDLLRETPKAVPLLNIQLPLWWFFLVGPVALALVHLNLLTQYYYLTQNVLLYDNFITRALKDGVLTQEQADEERKLPLSFALSNLILDRNMLPVLRILIRLLLWFFVVFAPLVVLLLFQGWGAPFHARIILWVNRLAVYFDGMVIVYIWTLIARAQGNHVDANRLDTFIRPLPVSAYYKSITALIVAPLLIASLVYITIPGDIFYISDFDTNFNRFNLYLHNRLLTRDNSIDRLLSTPSSMPYNDNSIGSLARKYSIGLKLKGRDLKKANLSGAIMPYSQMNKDSHLEEADLTEAHLEHAELIETHLEKTTCWGIHLEGAGLTGAYLEGAKLAGAHLEDADLTGVHLHGAHLDGAQLRNARLVGADLSEAWLVGADLSGVDFTGAILEGAHLEYSDLTGACFDGVRAIKSYFNGANLDMKTITCCDLRDAHFNSMNDSGKDKLIQEATDKLPPRLQARVKKKIDDAYVAKSIRNTIKTKPLSSCYGPEYPVWWEHQQRCNEKEVEEIYKLNDKYHNFVNPLQPQKPEGIQQ